MSWVTGGICSIGGGGGGGSGLSGLGSTDNAIVRTDGTGGSSVQGSPVTIADTTGQISWGTGGGAATHILGPTDQNLLIQSPSGRSVGIGTNNATKFTVSEFQVGPSTAYAGGGQIHSGLRRQVTARTGDLTLDTSTHQWVVNTNSGASGAVNLTLPSAAAGYAYEVVVEAAQYLRLTAATGDVIRADLHTGGAGTITTSASAGYIRSNEPGAYLRIVSIDATTWQVMEIGGTWTIDS